MGFSLFKLDVGDDIVSKSIDALSNAWQKIDDRHPLLGCLLILSLPTIAIYFIYTWGRLKTTETELDRRAKDSNAKRKRKKEGKK
ncbi:hypothetical protein G9400_20040 [Klebsiella michiganensis]|uniref:Uncharacterized protein n=1 Tax=Klebsiella spallanzanii TaxID=2587528 RepID=A0A564HWF1_9ENTR|nr:MULTISPECIES: hypothetical protein [Klebsiella]NHE81900.1 hypothetical protein [Klebsiella michiganensis]HBT6234052.1 hypothetical protein [Klebsiella quasipneumoniae]MBA7932928.1 hypothetical protein [Klebsiella sp. RHBSTW-00215]MBA7934070.1 hypothetical protein [Klebsiella sp. RHBSTW-00215]VUS37666.1 hypothetical protein SB6408_03230 [Klebsiella spallanzanii]